MTCMEVWGFSMQVRWNAIFMMCFTASMLLLWFTGGETCASYTIVWMGLLPLLVINSAITINSMILTEVMLPSDGAVRCESIANQVAWTVQDKLRMRRHQIEARVARGESVDIAAEPLEPSVFCVEGAVKALFWSFVVYDFTEADDHDFTNVLLLHIPRIPVRAHALCSIIVHAVSSLWPACTWAQRRPPL